MGASTRQILANLSRDLSSGVDLAEGLLRNVVSQDPNVRASLARTAPQMPHSSTGRDISAGCRLRVRVVEILRWANAMARYPIGVVR